MKGLSNSATGIQVCLRLCVCVVCSFTRYMPGADITIASNASPQLVEGECVCMGECVCVHVCYKSNVLL